MWQVYNQDFSEWFETSEQAENRAIELIAQGLYEVLYIGDDSASYGWVDCNGYHSEW